MGGGGIYFAVPRSIPYRWINDTHPGLIAVYQALSYRPERFIAKCRAIAPEKPDEPMVATKGTGKKYNARLKQAFDDMALNETCDQALRYLFVNRTVWAGRVNYDLPSRLYYSNPQGWNIVATDRLELAARHIKGTIITEGGYSALLETPGTDVFIYCDPPYVVNSDMPKTDRQYQYNFTLEEHKQFADAVRKCKHKVCISYDDSEIVRELFRDFNIFEEEWKYSGSSLSKKKTGKELLITNYGK